MSSAPQVPRSAVWELLDILGGLLVAASAGVWLASYNLYAITNADSMFLPALFGDLDGHGLGALRGWHWASSAYAVPDVALFAVVWGLSPRFATAIPLYAALTLAATVLACWWVMTPAKRGSFAVFSATFVGFAALAIALLCGASSENLVHSSYRYAAVSVHHYGNIVNTLLALGVLLRWKRQPTRRNLALLSLVSFVGVGSDVTFAVTFVAPAFALGLLLGDGSVLGRLRAGRASYVAMTLSTALAFAADALVNPLSPARTRAVTVGVVEALRRFAEARVEIREERVDTFGRMLFIGALVVLASRERRSAMRSSEPDRELHERRSLVSTFLLISVASSVAAVIVTGRYVGRDVDRYVLAFGFFPLFGVAGYLAAVVSERLSSSRAATLGVLGAGALSLSFAWPRGRADRVTPAYVSCIDELGLAKSAGLAPYWLAKPLVVFGDRRVQVLQVTGTGALYHNLINDSWFSQDWYSDGDSPRVAFALASIDRQHARMADGEIPFVDDGYALDPEAVRARFGPPGRVARCRDAEFWIYAPDRVSVLASGEAIRFPLHIPATDTRLSRGNAIAESGRLLSTGQDGNVVFGPYLSLPRGTYVARWYGAPLDEEGAIEFDVAALPVHRDVLAASKVAAASLSKTRGELRALEFVLSTETPGVETRLFTHGGAKVALDEIVIERR